MIAQSADLSHTNSKKGISLNSQLQSLPSSRQSYTLRLHTRHLHFNSCTSYILHPSNIQIRAYVSISGEAICRYCIVRVRWQTLSFSFLCSSPSSVFHSWVSAVLSPFFLHLCCSSSQNHVSSQTCLDPSKRFVLSSQFSLRTSDGLFAFVFFSMHMCLGG